MDGWQFALVPVVPHRHERVVLFSTF